MVWSVDEWASVHPTPAVPIHAHTHAPSIKYQTRPVHPTKADTRTLRGV